jgi:hypothetical protein
MAQGGERKSMNEGNEDEGIHIQSRWARLEEILKDHFGKKPNLESILFLVGMREIGSGPREFTKEEKVDLMHIAICRVLSPSGYYQLDFVDQEGWPHWKETAPLPNVDLISQEILLKSHIIDYFSDIYTL